MKQAILTAARRTELVERPTPEPGPGEVLVRVRACGVCASELHRWQGGGAGKYPAELGHEVAGEVVAVGAGVRAVAPGQRVTGLFQRGFAEYAVAADGHLAALPASVSYEAGIGEPIACIVSAIRRTRVEPGDTVAVVGLGFMGLLMLQAARLKGPARVIAIDPRADVRDAALALGADAALAPEEIGDELRVFQRSPAENGVDVAIETTGVQAGLTLAGELVRDHGMLAIVGYHQGGPRSVDLELWNWKALDVLNAHERRIEHKADCMRRGIALIGAGLIAVEPLITHRFGLDRVDAAFGALESKPDGFKKAVVVPAG